MSEFTIHRINLHSDSLPSDQLRQLARTYADLAKALDKLSRDPEKQLEMLEQLLAQESVK